METLLSFSTSTPSLIGFWLAHSLWETRDGSFTVREHQVASAIAAYQLLNL